MPTRSTKPTRWLAALSAAALALSLSACADDGGLPSVGGGAESTGAVDLLEAAQALHGCLSDAGLPVQYGSINGRNVRVEFDDAVPVIWVDKGGLIRATTAVPRAEIDAFYSRYPAGEGDPEEPSGAHEPFLQVAGVDHSETWARCLDSSGYDEGAAWAAADTSAMTDAYNRMLVEASNEWAKCARDNGHPNVIDAHMPPNDDEYPVALLPSSITEEQLRQLLEVCPTFDPAIQDANRSLQEQAADGDLADGYRAQPNVGFDFPGFDGVYSFDQSTLGPAAAATYDRLGQLNNLLFEAQTEYQATAAPG